MTTIMDPPKKPGKVIEFSHPHEAAVARIEAFVGRLMESNDLLAATLLRLRDFYLAGAPPLVAEKVLAQVDSALELSARIKRGF